MPTKKSSTKKATKKTAKKKTTRSSKTTTNKKESAEEMQASIARLLLGIIGVSIFITFFLVPNPF